MTSSNVTRIGEKLIEDIKRIQEELLVLLNKKISYREITDLIIKHDSYGKIRKDLKNYLINKYGRKNE
jgi:hypothetical protein